LMAVCVVDGARTVVLGGKMTLIFEAILGVWEVPPERITSSTSRTSRPAFFHYAFDQAVEAIEDLTRDGLVP